MPDSDVNEFLDWYCWRVATEGDRFHPPKETADACMNALYDDGELGGTEYAGKYGVEYGKHARAWIDSVEFFVAMRKWEFDPVERAQRYLTEPRSRGDVELPGLSWEWLRDSRYQGDVPDA